MLVPRVATPTDGTSIDKRPIGETPLAYSASGAPPSMQEVTAVVLTSKSVQGPTATREEHAVERDDVGTTDSGTGHALADDAPKHSSKVNSMPASSVNNRSGSSQGSVQKENGSDTGPDHPGGPEIASTTGQGTGDDKVKAPPEGQAGTASPTNTVPSKGKAKTKNKRGKSKATRGRGKRKPFGSSSSSSDSEEDVASSDSLMAELNDENMRRAAMGLRMRPQGRGNVTLEVKKGRSGPGRPSSTRDANRLFDSSDLSDGSGGNDEDDDGDNVDDPVFQEYLMDADRPTSPSETSQTDAMDALDFTLAEHNALDKEARPFAKSHTTARKATGKAPTKTNAASTKINASAPAPAASAPKPAAAAPKPTGAARKPTGATAKPSGSSSPHIARKAVTGQVAHKTTSPPVKLPLRDVDRARSSPSVSMPSGGTLFLLESDDSDAESKPTASKVAPAPSSGKAKAGRPAAKKNVLGVSGSSSNNTGKARPSSSMANKPPPSGSPAVASRPSSTPSSRSEKDTNPRVQSSARPIVARKMAKKMTSGVATATTPAAGGSSKLAFSPQDISPPSSPSDHEQDHGSRPPSSSMRSVEVARKKTAPAFPKSAGTPQPSAPGSKSKTGVVPRKAVAPAARKAVAAVSSKDSHALKPARKAVKPLRGPGRPSPETPTIALQPVVPREVGVAMPEVEPAPTVRAKPSLRERPASRGAEEEPASKRQRVSYSPASTDFSSGSTPDLQSRIDSRTKRVLAIRQEIAVLETEMAELNNSNREDVHKLEQWLEAFRRRHFEAFA